jgi:GAF domain
LERSGAPSATALDALYDSVARAAAGVLGAPMGFMTLGGYEVIRVVGVEWWTRAWLEDRPDAPRAIAQRLRGQSGPVEVHEAPSDGPLDGARALTAYPLRLSDGTVIGHLGALDTLERAWTPRQREALVSLARVCAAQIEARIQAAQSDDVRHIGRHLADDLAALESTVTPLLDHAAAHEDPVLQRRAAAVRARLDDVRLQQDHLDERLRPARPLVCQLDLTELVRAAVEDVERRAGSGPILLLTEPLGLPVVADPHGTYAAVIHVLRVAVREYGNTAVTVRVRRHQVASHAIDGTLAAELEVSVAGGFDPGEIARVGAAFARARGVAQETATMCVEGDQVSLSCAGLEVVTSTNATTVRARWPVDLG